jgi:hypothetical protein
LLFNNDCKTGSICGLDTSGVIGTIANCGSTIETGGGAIAGISNGRITSEIFIAVYLADDIADLSFDP